MAIREEIIKLCAKTFIAVAAQEMEESYDSHETNLLSAGVQLLSTNVAIVNSLRLMNDTLNDDESQSSTNAGVINFVEETVPAYADFEFHRHFRMSRNCYENLLRELSQSVQHERATQVPLNTKLLLALWTLGNQESYRQVADRFNMNRGTAYFVFTQMCAALVSLRERYIRWPTPAEVPAVSSGFRFPNAYGAIDGSHIEIKAPLEHMADYTNRKMRTSIVLQAVCDSRMIFLDISCGWPGSLHDARIFRLSNLRPRLEEDNPAELRKYHILGDSAYTLSTQLIVPYRDNGHLTAMQTRFNYVHSSSRTVIERAFAQLKGKFRRLKYLDVSRLDVAPKIVTAACVLHNFILLNKAAEIDDSEDDESDVDNEPDMLCSGVDGSESVLSVVGGMKRDLIAAML